MFGTDKCCCKTNLRTFYFHGNWLTLTEFQLLAKVLKKRSTLVMSKT